MEIYGIFLSTADIWLLGICGTLGMAWIVYRLTLSVNRRKSFDTAADRFRSKILAELEGLYPVTQHWDERDFSRLLQSIPKIENATEEFRFFVARKDDFDAAVKEYCDCCKQVTSNNNRVWIFFDADRKPNEISPRHKFGHCVKNLLSFTK